MQNIKIGIIGLGFVGGSIEKSFRNLGVNLVAVYDKFKDGSITMKGHKSMKFINKILYSINDPLN